MTSCNTRFPGLVLKEARDNKKGRLGQTTAKKVAQGAGDNVAPGLYLFGWLGVATFATPSRRTFSAFTSSTLRFRFILTHENVASLSHAGFVDAICSSLCARFSIRFKLKD